MSCKRKQKGRQTPNDNKKGKQWHVDINKCLTDATTKSALHEAWKESTSYKHGDVDLDCNPFPHCVINQFLANEEFLLALEKELSLMNFHSKSNDLYQFTQSDDLNISRKPCITELRSVLFERFRTWLSELLDVDLESTVDISCAKYQHTDVLLCHDDELEGRRVAFILYLVPPWEQSDGGTLDLFCTDELGQPQSVVKSLVPSWNRLVFFEVSPVSFHQVSEVLSSKKCRMSLSGWFHGPSLPRLAQHMDPPSLRQKYSPSDESMSHDWINPEYMTVGYQVQVQETFEDSSEIRLPNFLQEEKFQQVRSALQSAEIRWVTKGPPNKRHYEYAELSSLPPCVQECWELFSSEAFFLVLSNLTGLKLHPLAADNDSEEDSEQDEDEEGTEERQETNERQKKDGTTAAYVGVVRRWRHGSYTLLHDSENRREFGLDLLLTFGCSGWQQESGGFTSYIAHGEDEELLTVIPEDNSLALVYRDTDTLKFVKYINDRSSSHNHQESLGTFYDFSFVYYE